MKTPFRRVLQSSPRQRWYLFIVMISSMLVLICLVAYGKIGSVNESKDSLPVGLTGVQHMGQYFNISEFYVDGAGGGNVGRNGGGGSVFCCVMLPKEWRPGLRVELRWSVTNWSMENEDEIKIGNYKSLTWRNYKAVVPVEKYDEPGEVYVHFFKNGQVRIVVSLFGPSANSHPIKKNEASSTKNATVGILVPSLFSQAELNEMRKRYYKDRSIWGVNWK